MTSVFIVSALPAVRAGLATLVQGDPANQVVGVMHPAEGLLEALTEQMPDVTILDLDPADTPDTIFELSEALPGLRLLLLGPLPQGNHLPAALAGRAWAYLPRHATGDEILAAIRAVASGLVVIHPALATQVMPIPPAAPELPTGLVPQDELTAREQEVLHLIALGLPNKTIASRLGISEHTVKFHVASILSKLGASSRTEAVRLAARRGLIVL